MRKVQAKWIGFVNMHALVDGRDAVAKLQVKSHLFTLNYLVFSKSSILLLDTKWYIYLGTRYKPGTRIS